MFKVHYINTHAIWDCYWTEYIYSLIRWLSFNAESESDMLFLKTSCHNVPSFSLICTQLIYLWPLNLKTLYMLKKERKREAYIYAVHVKRAFTWSRITGPFQFKNLNGGMQLSYDEHLFSYIILDLSDGWFLIYFFRLENIVTKETIF